MHETPTDRTHRRLTWARHATGDADLTLQPASSDASFRSYWRSVGLTPSLIVMDAPPPAEDLRPWLAIGAQLAAAGIHVPRVYASDPAQGFALIEDLGRTDYLDVLNKDSAEGLYQAAMDTLARMQTRVDASTVPAYDGAFLRRELDLLAPWFLEGHLGLRLDAGARQTLEDAYAVLIDNALQQPQVFVHRDYHSRNLMLTDRANPGVIDFQGALRGPITYDLVSLLRDCYIRWAPERIERWCQSHRQRLLDAGLLDATVDAVRYRRWFDLTGMQRHIKVLGLFCRLADRDGKPAYLDDLPRVLGYVLEVAARYPELADLGRLLTHASAGRDLRQGRAHDPQAVPCGR